MKFINPNPHAVTIPNKEGADVTVEPWVSRMIPHAENVVFEVEGEHFAQFAERKVLLVKSEDEAKAPAPLKETIAPPPAPVVEEKADEGQQAVDVEDEDTSKKKRGRK